MDKFKLTITSILAFAGASLFPASISATEPGISSIDTKTTELNKEVVEDMVLYDDYERNENNLPKSNNTNTYSIPNNFR
ncbi:MAG: hypothetical protein HDR88_03730 [Bacteroides sp.]|nr:hypothetical protein [Bacteroides sp.]